MGQMKLIDSSEFVDRVLGKMGTPKRDAMERRLKRELEAYKNRQDAGGRQELTK